MGAIAGESMDTERGGDQGNGGPHLGSAIRIQKLASNPGRTALTSSITSSFVSRPFRTSMRRRASCSYQLPSPMS